MNRLLLALSVTVFSLVSVNSLSAQDSFEKWLDFVEGKWSVNITGDYKEVGTATFTRMAEGTALQGSFDGDRGNSVELGGWDSTRKMLTVNGYGPTAGEYWRLELKNTGPYRWSGKHFTELPDGLSVEADFEVWKVDDDNVEWKSKGKASDGQEVNMHGKFTRMKK